jgi:hypothetical protein
MDVFTVVTGCKHEYTKFISICNEYIAPVFSRKNGLLFFDFLFISAVIDSISSDKKCDIENTG